jgi:hypothetical protein
MTTVARWKAALQQIAAGAASPDLIAKEALRSRKLPPSTKPKPIPYEEREMMRVAKMLKVYEDWWDAGRPSIRSYAKELGVSAGTASGWLNSGGRIILHPRRSNHRLHKQVFQWKMSKIERKNTAD